MWYKELFLVRAKQNIILGLYTATALLMWALRSDFTTNNTFLDNQSIYNTWFRFAAVFVVVGAMIGGVDSISAEKNDNTLSFLITRPVSRLQIYGQKFLVNAVVMLGFFAVANLIVWSLDQIPHFMTYYGTNLTSDCFDQTVYNGQIEAYSAPFQGAFSQVVMFSVLSLAVLSVTTFFSIFGKTVIHSLMLNVIALFCITIAYTKFGETFGYMQTWGIGLGYDKPYHLIMFALITIFFLGLGLRVFSRKEF